MEDICRLHDAAVAANIPHYVDPKSGYKVMTAAKLASRGKCCGCGCRHCPYNNENVAPEKRANRISQPALLCGTFDTLAAGGVDLLFWSGGKDSYLAARALCRERGSKRHLVLMTTFDARSRQVAHQEVPIALVVKQVEAMGVPLIGVPVFPHIPYVARISSALDFISSRCRIERLCNGDLHLEYVRQWRLDNLGPLAEEVGASLHAPLWKVPYDTLAADLWASGTPCRVCAVTGDHGAAVGDLFEPSLLEKLDDSCDKFGEGGEFHSLAETWSCAQQDPLLPAAVDPANAP